MNGSRWASAVAAAAVVLGVAAGAPAADKTEGKMDGTDTRVFEMRIYYPLPGRMEALHKRFRDHTTKLFVKHGMTLVGFWVPRDEKGAEEKLVYILAYPSKEAADKSWAAFRADPDWQKVRAESEKDGPILRKQNPVESIWLKPTDYSPIK